MTSEIIQTRLSNGMQVMLKEIHNAPIVSHWVWYRVGSRDEIPGLTGISHWVEHMQFKGTPAHPEGSLDQAISRVGGTWNAFTYLDWTTFFETLPYDQLELAMDAEADRMVNAIYDPQEVASERTVIISEREGSENEPLFRLGEAISAAAFRNHPYRNEVIGSKEDLHRIQRDDLYHHYRSYYVPNNAVLCVAGDFESSPVLDRLAEIYRDIPAGDPPHHPAQPEESAEGEQRVVVTGPGETTFVELTYHSPAASDPDFFPFTVLDSLLTGPTSLNMFGGGGVTNKTSRLYRAVVENELAVSVHGGLQATIDPFLYGIDLTLRPGREVDALVTAVEDEIKRLQDDPVSPDEVARAIKQARALFAYGSENITNQGFWLGYAEMFAQYEWFTHYVERLAEVTPADVQRMAQKYLGANRRITGIYLPGETSEVSA